MSPDIELRNGVTLHLSHDGGDNLAARGARTVASEAVIQPESRSAPPRHLFR